MAGRGANGDDEKNASLTAQDQSHNAIQLEHGSQDISLLIKHTHSIYQLSTTEMRNVQLLSRHKRHINVYYIDYFSSENLLGKKSHSILRVK